MTYVSGGSIIAISVLFPLMGLLALGLRYYFRISKQQDIGPDDCLSAAAWVSSLRHSAPAEVQRRVVAEHELSSGSPSQSAVATL